MKILFLGYNKTETKIIAALEKKNCNVVHSSINCSLDGYDLVISFGYRHIISIEKLHTLTCPIINLHISFLPFNKGAHPNFWSFYEGTQSGVSIHELDSGVDTGPIIYQKKVALDEKTMTFSQTYEILIMEVENLFIKNIDSIINLNWKSRPQSKSGTSHKISDLPQDFRGWDSLIYEEIMRLKNEN